MTEKAELLAPAGDFDSLVAAVQNGADAVYFGGNMFNARRQAQNFDYNDMERAVKYAHLYNVKVYITFNILIKEREIATAIEFLHILDDLKVDGIIVQDIGLIVLIKELFPHIPIHASTQMTIHNLEGVLALQDMGISRVILAREVTLDEIEYIKSNSQVDLEVFIHGALCVSYSGQCLMSSMIGGRSGNRGMCAQPCRLPYEVVDINDNTIRSKNYLLSPKDLCTYDFLYDIIDAGISSLKIEGRMKRPEYVAVITKVYRQLIDTAIPLSRHRQDLLQIFNRGGFTSGYYFGTKNCDMMCHEKPNNWGVFMGTVISSSRDSVTIKLERTLSVGDGIEFWIHNGDSFGQTVDKIYIDRNLKNRAQSGQTISLGTSRYIAPGTKVYKTSSIDQLEAVRKTFRTPYASRKIGVDMLAYFKIGTYPHLTIVDEDGIKVDVKGDELVERAINSPLSLQEAKTQLARLGDTPFLAHNIKVQLDDNVFMAKSELNRLRRKAIDKLIKKRIEFFEMVDKKKVKDRKINLIGEQYEPNIKSKLSTKPKLMLYTSELNLDKDVIDNIDGICFCPTDWTNIHTKDIVLQVERYKKYNKVVRIALPRVIRKGDVDFIRSLDFDIWHIFDEYQGGNIGTIRLLQDMGIDNIVGDFSFNITNSYTLQMLRELGLQSAILSPELTIDELNDIIRRNILDCEVIVHGRLPLMLMEFCPFGRNGKSCNMCTIDRGVFLKDRMGIHFPIIKIKMARCYSQILNSVILFTAHELDEIAKLDVKYIGIYDVYNDGDLEMITKLYRYKLDNLGKPHPQYIEDIIQNIISRGYTKGHFFRGVS